MEEDKRPLPHRGRADPLNYLYRLRIGGDIPGLICVVGITLMFLRFLTGSWFWSLAALGVAALTVWAIHWFAGQ